MASDTIKAILRTDFDTATLTGTYQAVNQLGTEQACIALYITNTSATAIVNISYDGVTAADVLLPNSIHPLALQANAVPANKKALWKKGTVVYVSGTGAAGHVYLSGYYV